jgi:hypothetical protein
MLDLPEFALPLPYRNSRFGNHHFGIRTQKKNKNI